MPTIKVNPKGSVLSINVKITTDQNAVFSFRVIDQNNKKLGETGIQLGLNADEATHVFNVPVSSYLNGFITGTAEIEDNGDAVDITVTVYQDGAALAPNINLTTTGEVYPTFQIKK